jgi:hypothetical protein
MLIPVSSSDSTHLSYAMIPGREAIDFITNMTSEAKEASRC